MSGTPLSSDSSGKSFEGNAGGKVTLQAILQRHWLAFARRERQPRYVHRAAYLLAHCRTDTLGGHVKLCPHGHVEGVYYNCCRHRSCPGCSSGPRSEWLAKWRSKMLNTPACHIVFTVPQELVPLWRMNKREFASELFEAAKDALLTLLADPQFLGAEPGMLAALHTWSQTLMAHPHCHFIVTFGGLAEDGTWRLPKKKCLLPRAVLMHMFRNKLLKRLRRLVQRGKLILPDDPNVSQDTCSSWLDQLDRLRVTTWNVKLLERYEHAEGVALYLAKYLRGGPIAGHRLLAHDDTHVTFSYLDRRDGQTPQRLSSRIPIETFLQRWSQHIPPKNLHTVRAFGLYTSARVKQLDIARRQLEPSSQAQRPPPDEATANDAGQPSDNGDATCSVCGSPLTRVSLDQFSQACRELLQSRPTLAASGFLRSVASRGPPATTQHPIAS